MYTMYKQLPAHTFLDEILAEANREFTQLSHLEKDSYIRRGFEMKIKVTEHLIKRVNKDSIMNADQMESMRNHLSSLSLPGGDHRLEQFCSDEAFTLAMYLNTCRG